MCFVFFFSSPHELLFWWSHFCFFFSIHSPALWWGITWVIFSFFFLYLLTMELMRKKPNDLSWGIAGGSHQAQLVGWIMCYILSMCHWALPFRRAHIGDGAAAPFWTLMLIDHAMIMRWRSYNSWQPYRVLFLSIPSVLVGPPVSVGPFGSSNIQNGNWCGFLGVCCCKFHRTLYWFVKQVVPSWKFAL